MPFIVMYTFYYARNANIVGALEKNEVRIVLEYVSKIHKVFK